MTISVTSTEKNSRFIRLAISIEENEVGRASLFLISNELHEKPYGFLEDVWVAPNSRGKGYATKLVEEVIRQAKQEGCYKLIATSRFERRGVHELYKRLGFNPHGVEFRMDF